MMTDGLYRGSWPGTRKLIASSKFGTIAKAVEKAYIPEGNSTSSIAIRLINGTWSTGHRTKVKKHLMNAAKNTAIGNPRYSWLGTEGTYSGGYQTAYSVSAVGDVEDGYVTGSALAVAPSFTLDISNLYEVGGVVYAG